MSCASEKKELERCAASPGADACAMQFINYRECRRPGGPDFTARPDGSVSVSNASAYSVSSLPAAPERTLKQLTDAGMREAASLGIANGKDGVRF